MSRVEGGMVVAVFVVAPLLPVCQRSIQAGSCAPWLRLMPIGGNVRRLWWW